VYLLYTVIDSISLFLLPQNKST